MSTRLLGFLVLAAVTAGSVGCTLVAEERHPYYGDHRDVIVEQPRYRDPVVVQQAPPPPVVYQQQPTYVEPQPDVVVVREAPPPLRVERRPPAPWRDAVWVDGYWNHGSHGFVWVGGRWDHPPHAGAHWEPNRWDRSGSGFTFHAGGWR